MSIKVGKKQHLRPSGVVASNDGKYFYWECSVSHIPTFASAERFQKVLARFDNDESRLVKEFICKPVQKHLASGKSVEEILKLLADNAGDLPKAEKAPKPVKEAKAKKAKAVKVVAEDGVEEPKRKAPKQPVPTEEKPVYAWQKESNYFGNGKVVPVPVDVAEVTKDSCIRPDVHLDALCEGCPFYAKCVLPIKYQPEDWTDNKKRKSREVKVKQLVWVADETKA